MKNKMWKRIGNGNNSSAPMYWDKSKWKCFSFFLNYFVIRINSHFYTVAIQCDRSVHETQTCIAVRMLIVMRCTFERPLKIERNEHLMFFFFVFFFFLRKTKTLSASTLVWIIAFSSFCSVHIKWTFYLLHFSLLVSHLIP